MPELPEVETVRLGLQKLLPGKTIASVDFDFQKSFPNAPSDVEQFLVNAEIIKVKRRAKVLLIELSTSYSLVIHLKMTGQLVYIGNHQSIIASRQNLSSTDKGEEERFGAGHPNDSLIGRLPDKSTRVTLHFIDGSKLFFNDQRKFGWMKLLPTSEVPFIDFFIRVGPEPLEATFTPDVFHQRLQRRKNSNIKSVLLDQSILAGVGNIYADESLWAAQIHPETRVITLNKRQTALLHKVLIAVLRLSIQKGGSTDRNYVNAEGKKGSYITFANVFRKEGQPCKRCSVIIQKTKVAGRGTHICPSCQKVST
jgi:formamidopyrimidine-DNA glycosylase